MSLSLLGSPPTLLPFGSAPEHPHTVPQSQQVRSYRRACWEHRNTAAGAMVAAEDCTSEGLWCGD